MTNTTKRRAILAGIVTMLPVAAAPALANAIPASNPDAELIRMCEAYKAAVATYDREGGHLPCAQDPLWQAVEEVEARLDGMEARTMEGVLAKAKVAAFLAEDADGEANYGDSFTGDWPEQVIRDLLRLSGQA